MIDILLVEDSPTDAELTQQAFRESKLLNNIAHVKDGVEALAYLRRQGQYAESRIPHLILLDLNLPQKNGKEVLIEIKSDPEFRDIPVVILTSSDDEGDILGSYKHYANCYITKPVGFEKLVSVVTQIQSFWFNVVVLPPR